MKRKAVIDKHIPYIEGVLEPWFDVVYTPGADIDAEMVRDASALVVRTRTVCDEKLLAGSRVEFIATATIGFDHIDTAYCDSRGIEYATAAGCNARGVMEYAASALVHLARRQGWKPAQKTLGVIGVGNVGSLVAWLGRALGFGVVCNDPPKMEADPSLGYAALDELLATADIVTCHVPLNRSGKYKTLGLADGGFFAKMKPGSIFINTSRGEVADGRALKNALRSGKLSAAVLDVWEGEPYIDNELLGLVTLATPHIAGYSVQGKANAAAMSVCSLGRHFGLPLEGWYPPGVPRQAAGVEPTWEWLDRTIDGHLDVEALSREFRADPARFEAMRNGYGYHPEYF